MYSCNVWSYLENSKKVYGNKVAFEDIESSITFQQLYDKAIRIGNYIKHLYPNIKNHPIAVYMPKSIKSICCFLGIVYSGNYYVPLDYHSPHDRLEVILKTLEPLAIISEKEMDGFQEREAILNYFDCESYFQNEKEGRGG